MTLPGKLFCGLGVTGVATVGTYGVYGWYTEQFDVVEILSTNKEQIDGLVKELNGQCVLMVALADGYKPTSEIYSEEELNELYSFAKTKKSECSSRKTLVFKREQEQWSLMTEQQLAEEWTRVNADFSNNCDIKIFVSEENKSISDAGDLTGLFDFLRQGTIKTSCTNTDTTNKQEVVLKKSDSSWVVVGEAEQIRSIVKKSTFKCDIKVKVGSEIKTIASAADTELSGLLPKLKSLELTDCKDSVAPKVEKILKKESSDWEEFSDKEYVLELTKGWHSQCTLKIRKDKANKEIQDTDENLDGFYKAIKDKHPECKKTATSPTESKLFVYQKKGSNWEEMTEKAQIEDLISDWSNTCVLKIRVKGTDKGINDVVDTDVVGLYDALEKKKSDCQSSSPSAFKKRLLFKKDDSGTSWTEMSEKQQLTELANNWKGKCTLKIRLNNENKELSGVNDEDVVGLYEEAFKKNSTCTTASGKAFVFKKESASWKEMSEKEQITELSNSWSNKCTIKIWSGNTTKDVSRAQDNELVGLYSVLEKKKSNCQGTQSGKTKTTIIYKKTGTTWGETTEKQQIEELMKDKKTICTLKIRTGSGSSQVDKELEKLEVSFDLSGLYAELATNKNTHCPSGQAKKDLIYQKSGSSWKKVEPPKSSKPK